MYYILHELAVPVGEEPSLSRSIAKFLRIKESGINNVKILRKSLDSRKKNHPYWKFILEFSFQGEIRHPRVKVKGLEKTLDPSATDFIRSAQASGADPEFPGASVAIIGCGPAGMAAALGLAKIGYEVHVFEQGSDVRRRFLDIRRFIKQNIFNSASNILFGEGGAGTFSDGKLTSRSRTQYTEEFLRILVECGADESIVYLSHPHIGTDRLQFVIKNLREKCESLGCRFHFNTRVEDVVIIEGRTVGIRTEREDLAFSTVVLAFGLSARELYRKLYAQGVAMETKEFSVGVRVEHPQSLINTRQLGDKVDVSQTGAAEYFLTLNEENTGFRAYSFCMCPGGVIVPCADAENGLFTNGMSYSTRGGAFANSAVVVPVSKDEFGTNSVLAGIEYQDRLERNAFALGGGGFTFPSQSIGAYLENRVDESALPATSFQKPLKASNFNDLFSPYVNAALSSAFRNFDRKIPGFIRHGLIIGPESRTSSPLRILRDPISFQSLTTHGLIPLGEGAGYAGGIVSSGADGLRFAATLAQDVSKVFLR